MTELFESTKIGKAFDYDALRITSTRIIAQINVLRFIDADTGQSVCYLPALEISGYGANDEKAEEMAKFSVSEYFSYLKDLSARKREEELFSMGWKSDKLKNKEFSKAFIDLEGQLQNLNAVEGKVERLTLQTA